MIYLTGDTHGQFDRVSIFCHEIGTSRDDVLVILGDAGINYAGTQGDNPKKRFLSKLPITLMCIHGNHENRPTNIYTYRETAVFGGTAYWEPEYPNIFFAKDGEIYELGGKRCIAIGGAYSVDKHLRLQCGYKWFADEQPSDATKARVEHQLEDANWNVDMVLSHTCPTKYMPREVFMSGISQWTVDDSTEDWLDTLEDRLEYQHWFCGHFHIYKSIDKVQFLFEEFCAMELHT
jgi:3-oxoacid CoA-transferase subunit A